MLLPLPVKTALLENSAYASMVCQPTHGERGGAHKKERIALIGINRLGFTSELGGG